MILMDPDHVKWVLKDPNQIMGITSGCWDLNHFYHSQYFRRCRAYCDILVVGIDADDLVIKNKGKFPANPEYHRAWELAEKRSIDAVFIMRNLGDLQIAAKHCDMMFKNADTIYGKPVVKPEDCELIIVPDIVEVQSTTELKNKIVGQQN